MSIYVNVIHGHENWENIIKYKGLSVYSDHKIATTRSQHDSLTV